MGIVACERYEVNDDPGIWNRFCRHMFLRLIPTVDYRASPSLENEIANIHIGATNDTGIARVSSSTSTTWHILD